MIPAAVVVITIVSVLIIYLFGQSQEFDDSTTVLEQAANPGITAMAKAISYAEGYGIQNAIPTMANNPGDLKIPNWAGGTLGSGISVFGSDAEGWSRLYHQLNLIFNGQSKVYNEGMSISEMAKKWTATDPSAWANNVSVNLNGQGYNVTPDSILSEVIGG